MSRIKDWLRYPRTTQERRASQVVDGEPAPRPARTLRSLPSAWDDQWRHVEKCWKRFRRVRWREEVRRARRD